MIGSFLAGFAVGVFCILGVMGLLASVVAAVWRDGMIRHLNGRGR